MNKAFFHKLWPVAFYLLMVLPFSFFLFSCSSPDTRFHLEGRFKNLNQGEFYLYSPEQGTKDTIAVKDGRFIYDIAIDDSLTLVMLFPNYSEMPIFAHPGARVKMKGDVSHLKETEITGTKVNEEMTAFRLKANQLTPPEVRKAAADYISDYPTSPISYYLLKRYFIQGAEPDYAKASQLCTILCKADPKNIRLERLKKELTQLKSSYDMKQLPSFHAIDMNGKTIGNQHLKSEVNVIFAWATWNYDGQQIMRQIQTVQKQNPGRISCLGICLDPSPKEAKRMLERDSIRWSNVCDGSMFQMPIVGKLGIVCLPYNLITDKNGKILARDLSSADLRKKLDELLKK